MNFKNAKILSKVEQKSILGGTVNCKCNGTPLGTASDSSGCAALCQQCVSNGGCQPQQ